MRKAEIQRKTKETDISVSINLDGEGKSTIDTGIGFFDHMLELFSKHSLIDLAINARGDIGVDFHHTMEDAGITLGKAIAEAIGNKKGITRYGCAYIPMDESLTRAVVDLSGRSFLVYKFYQREIINGVHTELFKEFFRALADNAKMNLHVEVLYGENTHHQIEGIFKAFAVALREAVSFNERIKGLPSTKGEL
ncbi:imidazoleglycerol-phosphate dehydratase HisB [bacterium]|nr:imidazoleglycerol-phosphate dehydratase HisB [bacterium]